MVSLIALPFYIVFVLLVAFISAFFAFRKKNQQIQTEVKDDTGSIERITNEKLPTIIEQKHLNYSTLFWTLISLLMFGGFTIVLIYEVLNKQVGSNIWFVILIFLLLTVLLLLGLISLFFKTKFIFDKDGFVYWSLFRQRRFSWLDIKGFHTDVVGRQVFLVIVPVEKYQNEAGYGIITPKRFSPIPVTLLSDETLDILHVSEQYRSRAWAQSQNHTT